MGVLKTFQKYPSERLRLYVDYSCWLEETEKITGVQIVINPFTDGAPLVATSGYTDAEQKKLMVFFSAGSQSTTYNVSFIVTTDGGQKKRDDIGVKVLRP